ncbi:MAG: penicillin-binding protein 1B [Halofilum sp. (in: g-proteobacteria)]|nr:penicillin-binding protein 1B [Halofilum sp. (in: g-proteobacteria)]
MTRRSRSPRPAGRAGRLQRLRPWLLLACGVALAFGLASFFLLDARVRAQFGQTQWRLPAHVYTQPLELYPGAALTPAAVRAHLQSVGYRAVERVAEPGQYRFEGARLQLHTRAFHYPDGPESAQRLEVRFAGDSIAAVTGPRGASALARVQPQRIGSVFPGRQEDRLLVRLDEVPRFLLEGLIAVEDQDFRDHAGIQPSAVLRALLANLRAGRTVQGGSTLTQQLVKNFFLSPEQTLGRKFTEALMALSLEWHYSKDQILAAYLNEVYLGQDGRRSIHGVGLGARHWFNRPVSELQLHEAALLIGLIKGPSWYHPREHPERARDRRDTVLRVMARMGVVSRERARAAMRQPLGVVSRDEVRLAEYPAYLDLVREQLGRDYREEDLRSGGLRVFTWLDPRVQRAAEAAVDGRHGGLGADSGLQVAAVVAERDSGAVLALVGDREPRRPGFNRALSARRPVGSLIKPVVYLTALRRPDDYTLASRVNDDPLRVELGGGRTWEPQNHDDEFRGEMLLIDALVDSRNVATARLGLELGLDAVGRNLRRLGVAPARTLVPADLLGSLSLTPLQVTRLYQTIAAGGFDAPLRTIAAVHDADGGSLRRYGLSVEQVLPATATFLLGHALEQVAERGTGRALGWLLPDRRVAGKTGTTNDLRDSWFAGYDSRHVATVWVGRDDSAPAGLSGSAGALRIWADMMRRIPAPARPPQVPAGITWAHIDPVTGLQVSRQCPDSRRLPFIEGSRPARTRGCGGVIGGKQS